MITRRNLVQTLQTAVTEINTKCTYSNWV